MTRQPGDARSDYIHALLQGLDFVAYDSGRRRLHVAAASLSPARSRALYKQVIEPLRHAAPPDGVFAPVPVASLRTGYPVRCLERYCHERLDLNVPHRDTCLHRVFERTFAVSRLSGGETSAFDPVKFMESLAGSESPISRSIHRNWRADPSLADRLALDEQGWVIWHGEVRISDPRPLRRFEQGVRRALRERIAGPRDDRVLKIVESIRRNGWQGRAASGSGGGVLGLRLRDNVVQPFHGKHRVAALCYLFNRGEISGETLVDFPVIAYQTDDWRTHRTHPLHPCCMAGGGPPAGP